MPDANTMLQVLGGGLNLTEDDGNPSHQASPTVNSNLSMGDSQDTPDSSKTYKDAALTGGIDDKLLYLQAISKGEKPPEMKPENAQSQPGGDGKSPSVVGDVIKSTASAIPKGLQATAMFAPNLANLAMGGATWAGVKGYNALADKPVSPEQEARMIKGSMPFYSTPEQVGGAVAASAYNAVSDNPLSEAETQAMIEKNGQQFGGILHDPETTAGKFADTMTQFAVGGKAMGAAPVKAPAGSPPPGIATRIAAEAKAAAPALAGGAASEGAGQMFEGTDAELPARLIGGIAGQAGAAGGAAAMRRAGQEAGAMGIGGKTELAPGIKATEEQTKRAATQVLGNVTDSPSMMRELDSTMQKPEIVARSKPTLAEATTDQGIAQYQNAMRQRNPAQFQQRGAEQQNARVDALLQARGQGDAASLGQFFTQKLQADEAAAHMADQGGQRNLSAAQQQSQANQSHYGQSVADYGQIPAKGATGELIPDAQAFRKEQASNAWSFLEPYKAAAADGTPVITAAKEVVDSVNPLGGQKLLPAEKELYDAIQNQWPQGNVTFDTLKQMRTSIGEIQRSISREYGSESTPMMRTQRMKTAIDEAVENTVNGIVQQERQSVASGALLPEQSLEHTMLQKVNDWLGEKYAATAQTSQITTGRDSNTLVRKNSRNPTQGFPGNGRAAGDQGGQPGGAARVEGGEGEPVAPRFGEEQAKQYEDARQSTFKQKTLTDIEKSGAVNPDGSLNPQKYQKWYDKNAPRMKGSQLGDDLKQWHQQTVSDLKSVEGAQTALDDMRAARKAQERDYQKTRFYAMTQKDPAYVVGQMFKPSTEPGAFAEMVNKVKGDPDALAGLKAATVDYMMQKARVDIDDSGSKIRAQQQYRNFVAQNKNALREVLGSGQDMQLLEAVAADIKRNQAWEDRANIARQSNTAKNTQQVDKLNRMSILGKIMKEASYGTVGGGGYVAGSLIGMPIVGAVAAAVPKVASAMKAAGLDTIEKIQMEMIMNPEFGRAMLQKTANDSIPIPVQKRIGSTLLKTAPVAISNASMQDANKPLQLTITPESKGVR